MHRRCSLWIEPFFAQSIPTNPSFSRRNGQRAAWIRRFARWTRYRRL